MKNDAIPETGRVEVSLGITGIVDVRVGSTLQIEGDSPLGTTLTVRKKRGDIGIDLDSKTTRFLAMKASVDVTLTTDAGETRKLIGGYVYFWDKLSWHPFPFAKPVQRLSFESDSDQDFYTVQIRHLANMPAKKPPAAESKKGK